MRFENSDERFADLSLDRTKFNLINSSHYWLGNMLCEMAKYAMLNNLPDVVALLEQTQRDVVTAIDAHEQKISDSRNSAIKRMLR